MLHHGVVEGKEGFGRSWTPGLLKMYRDNHFNAVAKRRQQHEHLIAMADGHGRLSTPADFNLGRVYDEGFEQFSEYCANVDRSENVNSYLPILLEAMKHESLGVDTRIIMHDRFKDQFQCPWHMFGVHDSSCVTFYKVENESIYGGVIPFRQKAIEAGDAYDDVFGAGALPMQFADDFHVYPKPSECRAIEQESEHVRRLLREIQDGPIRAFHHLAGRKAKELFEILAGAMGNRRNGMGNRRNGTFWISEGMSSERIASESLATFSVSDSRVGSVYDKIVRRTVEVNALGKNARRPS